MLALISKPGRLLLLSAGLVMLPFAIYANGYHHAYQLDDAYTLVSNPSVRSLRNVPRFFIDPATYTSIREQVDYRPVLQTSYALDYALAGGYDGWWWHFTQVLLHAAVVVGLFHFCRRILLLSGDRHPDTIAFFAAALFAIHPTSSGVVMYFNARSSLLTAAFLLPALVAYMRDIAEPDYPRPQWRAATWYTLALFTKVEAVGALGALWAFELWMRGRERDRTLLSAVRSSIDARTWQRLAPLLGVTLVYFVIRMRVMAPFPFGDARHAADVGPYQYFLTQLTAWWYYVLHWLAPVKLIADNLSYPVFRSWHEPTVLLAFAGWLLVAACLLALWKRAPYLLFIAIAALALLSPTSSIAPLAEMVNEHRPYLPMGVFSLGVIIPAGIALRAWPTGMPRRALATGIALMLLSLAAMTVERNRVFETSESYWADVLQKAPSPRAHLNYGLALMTRNDIPGAVRHYREALEMAPYWYFTSINLGIALDRTGQTDSARTYFDRAVETDRYSGLALTWRGEFHLAHHEYADARNDFLRTLPLSLDRYRNVKGLATAYAGLGDVPDAIDQTRQLVTLDSSDALIDIRAIGTPFFENPQLRSQGIAYYSDLQQVVGKRPWIDENLRRLAALGNGAAQSSATVSPAGNSATQVSDEEQRRLMSEGLASLSSGDPAAAAGAFRRVLQLNPTHYGAHYQLAVALDRLGKTGESRALWQAVLRMAEGYNDQTTAAIARARLNRRP